ncbi:MAG: NAD-dependent DNA ligase LigA, partial [Planctomycetota bacterium]
MAADGDAARALRALRAEIHHHNFRYHVLDDPEISDEEYDRLFRRLEALEGEHPELDDPDSPTHKVGATWAPEDFVQEALPPVRHRMRMLSLQNVVNEAELREWEERLRRALPEAGEIPYA